MEGPSAKVSFGLIERLTALLVCARCLAQGVHRPVQQVLSPRHTPRPLCPDCRDAVHPRRALPAPVIPI
jgi:hypothetical protein